MRERLLSVDEVCELVNLRPWAVYRLIQEGTIPSIRIGRNVRVAPAALRARYGPDILPLQEPEPASR